MRVASLDFGSNTTLLLIADVAPNGIIKTVLHDQTCVTRMGQGVHQNREFAPEALRRVDVCLADYSQTIKKYQVDQVRAVATSAARDVKNHSELLRIAKNYGISIQIISGDNEARLTFDGAWQTSDMDEQTVVIDVGGGSTEIIARQNGKIIGHSVDVGSVRMTEMFLPRHPIPPEDLIKMREYLRWEYAKAPIPKGPFSRVIAVAGTPTTLAALELQSHFDANRIHGFEMSVEIVETWGERLSKMSVAEREVLPGMEPKRADVLVAGCFILSEGIRSVGARKIIVSTRGVRFGLAAQLKWPI